MAPTYAVPGLLLVESAKSFFHFRPKQKEVRCEFEPHDGMYSRMFSLAGHRWERDVVYIFKSCCW